MSPAPGLLLVLQVALLSFAVYQWAVKPTPARLAALAFHIGLIVVVLAAVMSR